MSQLTPRQIVAELDRHIVGQDAAKKAVAIALRNRWRRQQVDEKIRDEIVPKNILMIGPTGCGKTEIARRLAKLAEAPFLKVEATKFTEVGYVGRDVESIIRDLIEISINMVRERKHKEVKGKAAVNAENRLLDALVGSTATPETRRKFREMFESGELDDKEVEIEINDTTNPMASFDIPGMPGSQVGMLSIGDAINKAMGGRTKAKKLLVQDAYRILLKEESDKLTDQDKIVQEALHLVENHGIVFIDEIDKVASRQEGRGGEVSREGVQRDLLPLIEGTVVQTKHGAIKTDHVLFITSGAFHMAKPSDLLPELQGRLPIRVELNPLSEEDMERILREPEASLTKQYVALLGTEGVKIEFAEDGIKELAALATRFNREIENIGARRLHTIMEKLVEDISFNASENPGMEKTIDAAYVKEMVESLGKAMDVKKFIL